MKQTTKIVWVYGPENVGRNVYANKEIIKRGYQPSEVVEVANEDFQQLASVDKNKKVLVVKGIGYDWPDEELVSAWVRKALDMTDRMKNLYRLG